MAGNTHTPRGANAKLKHCQFCHRNVDGELVPVAGYESALACRDCAGRLDMSTWPAGRIVERFRRHWDRAHGQPGAVAKILVVEGSPAFQRLIEECL